MIPPILQRFLVIFLKCISLFAIIVSISVPVFSLRYGYNATGEQKLQDFIIGKWEGLQTQSSLDATTQYKLEFMDTGTLLFSVKSQSVEYYNIEYEYHFVSNDRIRVKNDRAGEAEWSLIQERAYLKVQMPNSREYVVFQRTPGIMWNVFAISLSVLAIATLLNSPIASHGSTEKADSYSPPPTHAIKNYRGLAFTFWQILVLIVFFGIGLLIANKADRWSLFLQIDEPWQPIIAFEIGMIMFIIGARLVRVHWPIIQSSIHVKKAFNQYLGVFLVGSGVYGILISLLVIVISLAFQK